MNAKTNLKSRIKDLTLLKRETRDNLRRLKAQGPETGEDRHQIRQKYNWSVRPVARAIHLAYGIIRGTKYTQIEKKCIDLPDPYLILKALYEADEGLKDVFSMDDVLTWLNRIDRPHADKPFQMKYEEATP